MRTICECAWSPAWWVGVGVLFLAWRIDIRIYMVHTKDMTTTENIADLNYSIDKATENIAKATKLRLTGLAQQIRRERRNLIEALAAVSA